MDKAANDAPLASRSRVILLGACKGQSASAIEDAIAAGLDTFGENRVQEAKEKWPDIKTRHPQVRLHLIGPLQTNKVKEALLLFDVIQTIDRPKLAEALSAEWEVLNEKKNTRHSTLKTQHLYIQINTGREPQKAGATPENADSLIHYCRTLGLPVAGLMCIPPAGQPPAPHFAFLREIARRHGLSELSMGMSEDFETAIRMGSTCVRIGRALFGERE